MTSVQSAGDKGVVGRGTRKSEHVIAELCASHDGMSNIPM